MHVRHLATLAVAVAAMTATAAPASTAPAGPEHPSSPHAVAEPFLSGTAWTGAELKAGHAKLEFYSPDDIVVKVCDDKADGWGVVAYAKVPRRGHFMEVTDPSSSGGCRTYQGDKPDTVRLAIKVCLYQGDRERRCNYQALIDKVHAGADKRAGTGTASIIRDDILELQAADKKADGWAVVAKIYDPVHDHLFLRSIDWGAGGEWGNLVSMEWPNWSDRLKLRTCKLEDGETRGCRTQLLADHHK